MCVRTHIPPLRVKSANFFILILGDSGPPSKLRMFVEGKEKCFL